MAQVCKALGLERLDPLELVPLPAADISTAPKVTCHFAEMNGSDYVVARGGTIRGAPAAWQTFCRLGIVPVASLRRL